MTMCNDPNLGPADEEQASERYRRRVYRYSRKAHSLRLNREAWTSRLTLLNILLVSALGLEPRNPDKKAIFSHYGFYRVRPSVHDFKDLAADRLPATSHQKPALPRILRPMSAPEFGQTTPYDAT